MVRKVSPKTYVFTAAQGIQAPYSAKMYGRNPEAGKPNEPLIRNIENYVKLNGAKLEICAVAGSYVNEIELDGFFHDRTDVSMHDKAQKRNEQNKIKEQEKRENWAEAKAAASEGGRFFGKGMPMHYFWEDIPITEYEKTGRDLNSYLSLAGTQTPTQNKDPLAGKQSLLKKFNGRSLIIPATKQRLKPFASGQAGKYPKIMLTTGACTHPSYNDTNQRGEEAADMHKYGFVVADIVDQEVFLPRVVPAQKNGTFIDLGIRYSHGKKPQKVETTAMVLGDSHVAQINPKIDGVNREMMRWFQPRFVHLNDVFDALSVNSHNIDDTILLDNLHKQGLNLLENEALLTAKYIYDHAEIAKSFGGTIMVNYSNHDDMVYRWLTTQSWKKDVVNRNFAYKLLAKDIERGSTLETMLKYVMPTLQSNVRFLRPGEDAIYWGFQCAAHGHLGKNGARGNLKNLMEGYTKLIKGHSHEFEINDDSINVGTSSMIPMPYQLGQPSTSMAANAVVYKGGLSQGIPIIKSRWAKKGFAKVLNH